MCLVRTWSHKILKIITLTRWGIVNRICLVCSAKGLWVAERIKNPWLENVHVTFWLTFNSLFSQVTVTSATYTFPCSPLSSVVSIVLFKITSLESDSISSMISSKLTQQRSSLANEKLKVGRWHSLVIKVDNFFISCIGCENETLVPNNSEKKPQWELG